MAEPINIANGQVIIPFEIGVIILNKNDSPTIELRKSTQDKEMIKKLVSCAYHGIPILILPTFKDRLKSFSNLIDKGIIYYDQEKKEYFYCF
jgi:hypothetical protein